MKELKADSFHCDQIARESDAREHFPDQALLIKSAAGRSGKEARLAKLDLTLAGKAPNKSKENLASRLLCKHYTICILLRNRFAVFGNYHSDAEKLDENFSSWCEIIRLWRDI